jgi:5-methylcytosine-specific restriction endonuclease McrA
MSPIGAKPARLRLDPVSYGTLRQQVLRRDGWRCQSCGTMSNLEIHHKEFRSHSGHDSEQNLITLCRACHAGVHLAKRVFVFPSKQSTRARPPESPE